jgi:hypothetical protein
VTGKFLITVSAVIVNYRVQCLNPFKLVFTLKPKFTTTFLPTNSGDHVTRGRQNTNPIIIMYSPVIAKVHQSDIRWDEQIDIVSAYKLMFHLLGKEREILE